ncbi:MAG: Rieske 2Fe-2S domain-containing protein [Pirellulales bacterium]
MADQKKMSVADILAAARKADGGGSGDAPPSTDAPGNTTPAETVKTAPAAVKPAPKSDGGRPSVADILALARQKEPAAAQPAAPARPKPKPAVEKPVAAKTQAVAAGPVDTQSILTAARTSTKPGPITKAEAAAKAKTEPPRPAVKPAIIVPPMPIKPAYAQPKAAASKTQADRRTVITALAIGFSALAVTLTVWTLATVRFMFPNVLREPPSRFKVGFPDAFPPGNVDERFKAQFGVWVVNAEYNGEMQLVALKTVCTHLGCTPNWLDAEQKFKCPCHGSGFYKDGINFEGPAPRPLERYAISIADDGQVQVDKSRIFQEEMGQWSDPTSFIPV